MIRFTTRNKAATDRHSESHIPEGFFVHLYATAGRVFPWRKEETSPFGILVAELLLKQTHANKVALVWPHLITRYRDAGQLAIAKADELYGIIAALGFGRQRTKALIDVGQSIAQTGDFPSETEDLIKLPYVGVYTAHAVACFAFRPQGSRSGPQHSSDVFKNYWHRASNRYPASEVNLDFRMLTFAKGLFQGAQLWSAGLCGTVLQATLSEL